MEIRDLQYLLASADAGNFGRAAKSLGLNTSTISRRIGKLEDELGLALFERGHAGVRLTAGGRAVIRHVRRALAELDAVKHTGIQNGSGGAGEIRLGVRLPPSGGPLGGLLAHWHGSHPNVVLTISEMSDRDLAAALEERRLDVALMLSHAVGPHATCVPLYRDRLMAAIPAGHALARRASIDWDALHGETILVQGWDESQAARELFASFLGSTVRFHSHAASKHALFALVGAGFGIALTAASLAEVAIPGVVFKAIDDPDAVVQIVLAWLPELEDAAVGRFVAFLRDQSRSRPLV
jgi:DNA-binding transcriptional LysR family regulator